MISAHTYDLCIAGLTIRMETDFGFRISEPFAPFLCICDKPDYRAVFRRVDELPAMPDKVLYQDDCYRIHPNGHGGFLRSFFDAPRDLKPYASVDCDYSAGQIGIAYLKKGQEYVSELDNSFFHLGLERILLQEDRVCLHASCVSTPMGGLLFSGVSGIGKSTQAELWCRYRGGKLINGDRPILSATEDGVLAWGSPYAGSSRCYVNESVKASAIIMLKQAPVCSIRRMKTAEAFRSIYSGLTIQSWDGDFVARASDLALQLAMAIPVYEFSCTPDEAAVNFLENALKEGGENER